MGLIVKVLFAGALGWGMLTAVQFFWLAAIMQQIAAAPQAPLPQAHFAPSIRIDSDALRRALGPMAPLDTQDGQRRAIESAARRIDMINRNALSHVPLPPGPYGLPRH